MISTLLKAVWLLLRVIGCYFIALWHLIIPSKPKSVAGNLVLVTGGRRGIGRALAMEFAKHGANIVLWDIDKEETEQAANDIRNATGVKVGAYVCDVTDCNKVKATAAQVRSDMGNVDILVNNAALCYKTGILEQSEEKITNTINVNILSHFWTLKEFLPDMIAKKEGHIVSVSSFLGYVGLSSMTDYCASKFAVRGLYESLEQELRCKLKCPNIPVTVLFPGAVRTPLLQRLIDEDDLKVREEDALSPEFTAKLTVDGVLRNQRHVFAPSALSLLPYLTVLLPKRARNMLLDLAGQ